ncbi:metal ABC transporter permease [Candidatus Saccharibacteria bacterium]|nr:metal ABC transporter permease [Candidatus Saccharibacteria bacterium]
MNWLSEMLSYTFMQRALIVGLLISICAALVGVSLVLRKNSMIGDGLSHTTFGAFAIATALNFAPLWFAVPVVVATSFFILKLSNNKRVNGDALIALLSASSLAIGTMAISLTKGVNIDLNSYLFGSILSIGWSDVWLSLALTIAVVLLYIFAHNRIFAITFDEDFAKAIGIKTNVYDAIFAIICSLVIVFGMRLLGALLISSLIIFPTLIAMQFAKSFGRVVIYSVFFSVINFVLGLTISYLIASPTGSTIVIVNLITLIITYIIRKIILGRS